MHTVDRRPAREWIAAGTLSALIVTIVRIVVSWDRREFVLWPDEPAQLAIARYVGGGTPWTMHNHSVWRPLYGTLLSPVHWFTDDPATVYRTAMVLNAVLGGIAAALLVALAWRLTAMSAAWSAFVATLVSLTPAVLLTTGFVFAESLVVALYLATLWCLLRFHEMPSLGRGAVAGILAGLAFGAHSRMLPLAVVVVGVTLLAAGRQRLATRSGVAIAVITVSSVVMMSTYTSFLVDRLWDEPSTRNSPDGVLGQLGNVPATLLSLTGQGWTLLVSSLGVIAYGTVALVLAAFGRDAARPRRDDARLVLVTVGACVALSVVFMSDRWRNDQLVYGRYNAAVVGPVLVVGLAVLFGRLRMPRLAVIAVATVVATLAAAVLLWSTRRDLFLESNGLEPMILGLQPFITSAAELDVPRITLWAALCTAVVAVVARWAPAVATAALLAVLVVVGTAVSARRLEQQWNVSIDVAAVVALREQLDGVIVDFFLPQDSNATMTMMRYQESLPHTRVHVTADASAGPAGSYVFAPTDAADLRAAGATLVWRDPRRDVGLWRR